MHTWADTHQVVPRPLVITRRDDEMDELRIVGAVVVFSFAFGFCRLSVAFIDRRSAPRIEKPSTGSTSEPQRRCRILEGLGRGRRL